jgi:hypothetical protein
MKRLLVQIFIFISSMLLYTGCASSSVAVKTPESELMSNKEKAYIIFAKPESVGSDLFDWEIMEFNPKTSEPKLVASLPGGSKSIYEVDEGEHYFTSFPGRDIGFMTKIDVKKGQKYYTYLSKDTAIPYALLVHNNDRLNLLEKIKSSKCDKQLLDKYLFMTSDNYHSKPKSKNGIIYTSKNMFLEIECSPNNEIINIQDLYFKKNIFEISKLSLFEKTKEAVQEFDSNTTRPLKAIRYFYPTWKNSFQDVFYSEIPFVNLKQIFEDKYYKEFDSITIVDNQVNYENLSFAEFNDIFEKSFTTFKNGKNPIIIKYTLLKLHAGSKIGRGNLLVQGDETYGSFGSILVNVDFYDKNNQKIGSIDVSQMVTGGPLGGLNNTVTDTVGVINEYVKRNFLK